MDNNAFTVLFDYDSMIYKAVYKITESIDYKGTEHPQTGLIRKWFKDKRSKEWMTTEIINLSLNRLANMGDAIFLDIEDTGINIIAIEYFLTVCSNSKRKEVSPIYKANRKKRNKWVGLVRKHLIEMDAFIFNEFWEADDLVKDRAMELGEGSCIICSIDKDLKQIPGYHFDYYRPILKDENGELQLDENGNRKIAPCRGLDIVTDEQAAKFFWTQMLMGDSGDNIKGIPRVGKVKAAKIIEASTNYEETVKLEYIKYFGEIEGNEQFELHKILLGLGIRHRP